jgi:hypothetical protein
MLLNLKNIVICIAVLLCSISLYYIIDAILKNTIMKETFENKDNFKEEKEYSDQVKLLSDKYTAAADSKRPVTEIVSTVPEKQQCLLNFYALGCRFTGYMGPMVNGYFDPDIAVQYAVKAGCRVFVLEIDYMMDCDKYFPRIVVRDVQGKFMIKYNSSLPTCNTLEHSTIRDICEKINFYAFTSQNSSDPVIIVLYFLRQPPGSYKSSAVLDYYSNVAKCLEPFKDRLLTNEIEGGTYYRQKQEGQLLINKITDYNNKVLIFSNANTTGFREVSYSPSEDLDFLVNLRLSYTQTKLGVSDNTSGSSFGILETVQDYMNIPDDRADTTIETTKSKWTICFSNDPTIPVSKDMFLKVSKFGVHCIPIVLFDKDTDFMFEDILFKKHSFLPKPESIRYIPPAIVVPGEPNPSMNAAGGKLQMPSVQ